MSFSDKYPPPFDRTVDEYRAWKRDFELWQSITEAPKIKQGVLLSLRLDKVTRDEVCEAVSNADLVTEGGVKKVLDQLDKIFIRDKKLTAFEAYEHFESYERPGKLPITEYVKEFQKRLKKVENDGTKIADHILAYRLIKSAKLSESQLAILKATTDDMTYEAVSTQLKKISISKDTITTVKEQKIKEEPSEDTVLYGRPFRKQKYRGASNYKSEFNNQEQNNVKKGKKSLKKRGKNPLDQYGRVTRCIHCESINHWIKDCPDMSNQEKSMFVENAERDSDDSESDVDSEESHENEGPVFKVNHATAQTENFYDPIKVTLSCKTMSSAVLDCGAPKTVCGRLWLLQYIDGLSESDKNKVVHRKSKNIFKFGCGTKYPAYENVSLPALLGSKEVIIDTDVVEGDIPLLFGKEAMKKAGVNLDCKNDTLEILGETVNLEVTESGHYALPLGKKRQTITDVARGESAKLTLVMKNISEKEMALKLHRQFAHPSSERLIKLVLSQGKDCPNLVEAIREVTKRCKICALYKKPSPRPVVGFPLATRFGEVVAMDLKQFGKVHLLHIIDHATRLCAGSIIKSKSPEVIVRDVFKYWISVFGAPEKILSDNGGEFCNPAMRDLAERFNLNLVTTAAESPWSNGLVERHNLIMGEMIEKTQEDTGCSLEMATMWSVCAHNSLANIHGFTPFQLVFGRNPVLPSLQVDRPPALDSENTSDMVRNNLNSMHAARQAHIRCESSEKVKRALSRNVRTSGEIRYITGDRVYYKRLDSKKWRGPGVVIGQDGKQVLVKHQNIYVRVHPCRLSLENQTIVGSKNCTESNQETHQGDPEAGSKNGTEPNQETHQGDPEAFQKTRTGDSAKVGPTFNQEAGVGDRATSRLTNQENGFQDSDSDSENMPVDDSSMSEADESDLSEAEDTPEGNSLSEDAQENDQIEEQGSQVTDEITEQSTVNQQFPENVESEANIQLSLLKQGVKVRYKEKNDDSWTVAVLGKRAGKKKGIHENCWNLTKESGEAAAVDFKKDVEEWNITNYSSSELEELKEIYLTEDYIDKTNEETLKAMKRELNSWKSNDVYVEVENTGQEYVTGKWVIKPKIIDGKHSVKARYVLRGFEEPNEFRTDSPMCMKASVRLLLAIISSCRWKLGSIDFKTAFLQGKPIVREVYMRPPLEANTNKLWKLKKTVYGLRDAPRQWYLRVKSIICELGCKLSSIDNSLFMSHNSSGSIVGVIAVFVDDVLYGGTVNFLNEVICNLRKSLLVGSEQSIALEYLGIHVEQKESCKITLNQNSYIDSLKIIEISEKRLKEKLDKVSQEERKMLRSSVGQLNWLCTMSRPDIGFTIGQISLSSNQATVSDIYNTNKLINHVKNTKTSIVFPNLDLKKCFIQVFTDASYANLRDGGSQGGYIIFITDGVNSCPLEWRSCKLKRVVKSIMSAETLALVDGIKAAYVIGKLV